VISIAIVPVSGLGGIWLPLCCDVKATFCGVVLTMTISV
jgi:hypothetical protein